MTDTVADRVVIVTGASSGIGEATARLLHERGALPVLAARRADRLAVLGKKLGGALAVPTDVTDPAAYLALLNHGIQAVLPHMRANGGGRIINISSGSTAAATPGVGAYPATKCAANMLSEVARLELANDNIRITLVLPSITATEFRGGMYADHTTVQSGGLIPHSSEYVARVALRALRTGEARIAYPTGRNSQTFPTAIDSFRPRSYPLNNGG